MHSTRMAVSIRMMTRHKMFLRESHVFINKFIFGAAAARTTTQSQRPMVLSVDEATTVALSYIVYRCPSDCERKQVCLETQVPIKVKQK